MGQIHYILLAILVLCVSCEWQLHLKMAGMEDELVIDRYDRVETLYLTTGDFSALQHMNIDHPIETRTLIEDVLKIGHVNDSEINNKFLRYFQDSTLQVILNEVGRQYADIEDITREFRIAFSRMQSELPNVEVPHIYTQIGALDQSVIITNNSVGICLDKYLGEHFKPYHRFYPLEQRQMMTRKMIVPDCLNFYLLSLYPLPFDATTQLACDLHMAKIQWMVNKLLQRKAFRSKYITHVDAYVQHHEDITFPQLMSATLR